MRTKAARVRRKAQLELAFQDDPEARARCKDMGVAAGMKVLYVVEASTGHIGTVLEVHLKSVEIIKTGTGLGNGYSELVLSKDIVPFSAIKEVLGPGTLPASMQPSGSDEDDGKEKALEQSTPPPPREGDYQFCDIGECESRPVKAYAVKKWDKDINDWGPLHIVAVCKSHDERYIPAGERQPAHIPIVWQLGVVGESWKVPKPEGESEPTEAEKMAVVRAARKLKEPTPENGETLNTNPASKSSMTDSPYEGKRGRHPTDCGCSRHGGAGK